MRQPVHPRRDHHHLDRAVGPGLDGTYVDRSVALSPDGTRSWPPLTVPNFPHDLLTPSIRPRRRDHRHGQSRDGHRRLGGVDQRQSRCDYVWVLDQTAGDGRGTKPEPRPVRPASQPYVTAVGGTSLTALGPAPTETTWNDQLNFAEGAGGGDFETFSMPAYQQPLAMVTGSTGTPCGNSSGPPATPTCPPTPTRSTGYIIYDPVNSLGWEAIGGTSGAAPLWAAVLPVSASANGNTAGYGA